MGKSKRRKKERIQEKIQEKKKKKSALRGYIIAALIVLVLAGVGGGYFLWNRAQSDSANSLNSLSDPESTKASVLPATPRRPRPQTLSPALFTGRAAEAYQVAREVPELIEQMPCYCGCYEGNEHQNNLDCYVDKHAVT